MWRFINSTRSIFFDAPPQRNDTTSEFIGCETGSSTMHCAFIHRRKNRNGWPPMAQAKGRKFKFLAADQPASLNGSTVSASPLLLSNWHFLLSLSLSFFSFYRFLLNLCHFNTRLMRNGKFSIEKFKSYLKLLK